MNERFITRQGMIFMSTSKRQFQPNLQIAQSRKLEDGTYHGERIYLNREELIALREHIDKAIVEMERMEKDAQQKASQEGRPIYANQKWNETDDERLEKDFDSGISTDKIAQYLQRSERAIWYRLQRIGKIKDVPPQFLIPAKG